MKMEGSNFLRKAKTATLGLLALGLSSKMNAADNNGNMSLNSKDTSIKKVSPMANPEDLGKKFEFRQLTEKQMQDWNKFIDFVEKEGYKDSPELDKSKEVWDPLESTCRHASLSIL